MMDSEYPVMKRGDVFGRSDPMTTFVYFTMKHVAELFLRVFVNVVAGHPV